MTTLTKMRYPKAGQDHTTYPLSCNIINENIREIAPYVRGRGDAAVTHIFNGGPAPAWYSLSSNDIAINDEYLDGISDDALAKAIRTSPPMYQFYRIENPTVRKLYGLIQHEFAHCRWSHWLMTDSVVRNVTNIQYEVLSLFEEIRIEKRAIDATHGYARPTLRSSFEIVLDSIVSDPPTSKSGLAAAWVLAVGRAYSTVASHDEVRAVDDVARNVFSDETVDTMHDILDEAVVLEINHGRDGSFTRLIELVDWWIELVSFAQENDSMKMNESSEFNPSDIGADLDNKDTDSQSAPNTADDGDAADDDKDATDTIPGDTGSGSDTVIDGRLGTPGVDPSKIEDNSDKKQRDLTGEEADMVRDVLRKMAEKITNDWNVREPVKLSDPGTTASEVFKRTKKANKYRTRPPRHDEQRAATDLARRIELFTYSAPDVTKVRSYVPPGRLNSREALRATAERSRGQMLTAKPWQAKKRRHTYNPPITVGLMTDISGSMGWARETVASTAYIFSKAMTRVSGRFAAVTFGDKAEAVVWPNEVLNEVRVRDATGGTEQFDKGVAALDGVLKLTTGKGVRLLVVVSDGHFVAAGMPSKARAWYDKLDKAGVGIVWINGFDPTGVIPKNGNIVVLGGKRGGVTSMIDPIADAMERAIVQARR